MTRGEGIVIAVTTFVVLGCSSSTPGDETRAAQDDFSMIEAGVEAMPDETPEETPTDPPAAPVLPRCEREYTDCGNGADGKPVCCAGKSDCGTASDGSIVCKSTGTSCGAAGIPCAQRCCPATTMCDATTGACQRPCKDSDATLCPNGLCCPKDQQCTRYDGDLNNWKCVTPPAPSRCTAPQWACMKPDGDPNAKPPATSCCNPGTYCDTSGSLGSQCCPSGTAVDPTTGLCTLGDKCGTAPDGTDRRCAVGGVCCPGNICCLPGWRCGDPAKGEKSCVVKTAT
jgi:hypothetical protein